jgi:predicted acyltransferase
LDTVKPERLISLDVFRGMTIAGMIIVNSPGSSDYVYPQLAHADWHGCTFADFIFPFFLFIVGVAVTLSLSRRKMAGDNQTKLLLRIFTRSAVIFLLGLLLGFFPQLDFSGITFTGVLKRIAVVYFFTALIFLKTSLKSQAIIAGLFLIGYWVLLTFIPVPGIGPANLGKETNLAAWIDNLLLKGHLSNGTWDSLGVLSTVPAISNALLGVLTGHLLMSDKDKLTKTVIMFVAGNILILAGYFWDFWFPINKNLWTSSLVLFTCGFALNFLALCYWIIDIKGYKKWTKPFLVFGMNAITVYFLAVLVGRYLKYIKITDSDGSIVNLKVFIYNNLFLPFLDPVNASLAYSLVYTLLWLGLMWILYARKIFIKV